MHLFRAIREGDFAATETSASVAGRLWALLVRAHRARAAYRALSALDDHMLRDIGLSRSDILAASLGRRGRRTVGR